MKTTRSRAPNYSTHERKLLFSLVKKHDEIINSKVHSKDKEGLQIKHECWKEITKTFNKQCSLNFQRTTESLVKFYENHKSDSDNLNLTQSFDLSNVKEEPDEDPLEHCNIVMNSDNSEQNTSEDAVSDELEKDTNNCATNAPPMVVPPLFIVLPPNMQQSNGHNSSNGKTPNRRIMYRKRKFVANPVPRSIHSKNLAKIYKDVAEAKLRFVNLQINVLKRRAQQQAREFKLKELSLKLEIRIKRARFRKINNPSN